MTDIRVLLNTLLECHVEHFHVKMRFTKVFPISIFLDALMNLLLQIKLYFLRAIKLSRFLRLRST